MADVYETTARAILTMGTLVLLAGKASEDFWTALVDLRKVSNPSPKGRGFLGAL